MISFQRLKYRFKKAKNFIDNPKDNFQKVWNVIVINAWLKEKILFSEYILLQFNLSIFYDYCWIHQSL